MKVYIALDCINYELTVLGVFSTAKLAAEHALRGDVLECTLDSPDGHWLETARSILDKEAGK